MPPPTVLVVEDDPVILRLLEVNFELEGFSVLLAHDGAEGIEMARAEKPDIISATSCCLEPPGSRIRRRRRKGASCTDPSARAHLQLAQGATALSASPFASDRQL
ncbi:MAG: hypothetical protein H0V81_17710 [Solirubrobacterales bacterium]|nr:hypothetical protein [Solirubrobacterales bacterium]